MGYNVLSGDDTCKCKCMYTCMYSDRLCCEWHLSMLLDVFILHVAVISVPLAGMVFN